MRTVHRFPIRTHRVVEIEAQRGSVPIHFGYQEARREFSVWMLVTDDQPRDQHTERFQMVGTGGEVELQRPQHVGSVVMPDGFHTFHLFREMEGSGP